MTGRRLIGLIAVLTIVMLGGTSSRAEEITLMDVERVTDLIMSPGCNYMYTLTNCPSAEAEQMREIVKDKLRNGESAEAILNYFEEIYGPRVLAQPKKKGFYFVAWWFPYFLIFDVFLLIGLILYVWQRRGKKAGGSTKEQGEQETDTAEMDSLLEEELRRFKE
ncbi:MAG: hypothetical protein GXO99_01080 [Nitrospirae bacterium]|nr:hypothetical protein [Nitrospirota bacterium]